MVGEKLKRINRCCAISLLSVVFCGQCVHMQTPKAGIQRENYRISVQVLHDIRLDTQAIPEFISATKALACERGWARQFTHCQQFAPAGWEAGRRVRLLIDGRDCCILILKSRLHSVPGWEAQTVILTDDTGNLSDYLMCVVSSRHVEDDGGVMDTFILDPSPSDRALFAIRLFGTSAQGNWSHCIIHADKQILYAWDHEKPSTDQLSSWDRNGLCRFSIQEGKIRVISP